MTIPISLVCLTASPSPRGRVPTFLGVADPSVMTDDAQDRGLTAVLGDGVAHRLAVDGQGFVAGGIECIPGLQGAIQWLGIDAGQHFADDGATGDLVTLVAVAATKARPSLLAQVGRPGTNGLVYSARLNFRVFVQPMAG